MNFDRAHITAGVDCRCGTHGFTERASTKARRCPFVQVDHVSNAVPHSEFGRGGQAGHNRDSGRIQD
jgi:hypothetical protein